ncbi:MAG: type II toxin-antitoxin system MqsR family toxin [Betaproteobacteria bacterium]|nr:type II toxin-antitoxin system MqsR family toxin [Betaproteobacteria bacterium]
MEKRKAHYPLATVKRLIAEGRVSFTMTAVAGGAAMGFASEDMLDVVSSLKAKDLYKSMTSHADHKVWHDVYHADTERGLVYLKLTAVEELLIISFKEKDE